VDGGEPGEIGRSVMRVDMANDRPSADIRDITVGSGSKSPKTTHQVSSCSVAEHQFFSSPARASRLVSGAVQDVPRQT